MINVCLIGLGNWGKKVLNSIKKIKKIKSIQIVRNRRDKTKVNLNNLNWVFVTTPTNNHYSTVKKYLKKKINVFCEKPLADNLRQAMKLYNLAKKNNVILYVDDIEMFKNKKILFSLNNIIERKKKDKGSNYSLIERLFYHDAYLIYEKLKNRKIKIIKQKHRDLKFQIYFSNKVINFFYSIDSRTRIHKINNMNLLSFKGDPLKKMIVYVLYKLKNYSKNKNRSLFALKMCNLLKKYY